MTAANGLTYDIHDRMPVILDPADYNRWLDSSAGEEILKSYPSEKMTRYQVSRTVGSVKKTGPKLIEPIE